MVWAVNQRWQAGKNREVIFLAGTVEELEVEGFVSASKQIHWKIFF